ncbi:protein tramtrack, alpha isoform-like isoform X1 [Spodoptera frugiperda]|uniref:Protein tramtrack, alpha isoform-like isoform X1 n=1 Tax=Spodoptera frugiperda TaxID=7108 RepID=A0A9R0EX47_SPOFR|nr:protein tramtrack, alpha isoform-like isoform X1 [Spodoptera frugiperda]XP_050553424.1 protein tramtrack, alpha isoform-like isoform X1 [Spodoptera frugiperda]XP_050553425.1 protein tramtrack, alpha isoform-like isoform X1 [Spodoptera frugiperda]XP_050553426.1 protein tramtrack, alpha isoform-like isoform X1 [Spodoptera frugiperda]XP_050553427.1 protein tramtrack, alpha isoform-like isoform X1 [Spodoptera frugiperda]XP_050553428.1 protein tramtrack, alpha isoform-like isoform X1 [Spodoptera
MATQRFCLRWNNHQSNMLSVFDQLLHAETFTDVTLAVDGQLLKAHKMVLSACSPYFQALFVNHQEKHPIVILKDVPYSDMKSLLDFMYRGEVSVDQERLTAFLKVAESLRIKGLTEVNEEKCDIPALTNSLIQQQSNAHTPPPQLHRIHPYMHQKRPASGMPSGGAPPNLLMPLLGNALMQPKRKRGRPRKLSGSSSDALNTAASPPGEFAPEPASHGSSNRPGDQLIRGSPEMLEVKMSMDSFNTEDGATSGGEEAGEALLIDEGDDAQSTEAPTGKDSESAELTEYHYTFDDEVDNGSIPIITLEVMSDSSIPDPIIANYVDGAAPGGQFDDALNKDTGVHFLTEQMQKLEPKYEGNKEEGKEVKGRHDLLEYMLRTDGSVICKMCGEILQSRTHWYRHKYKRHAAQPPNPAPLFQCEQCLVYFKSRKGYIGHIASRHSELLSDSSPVLTNTQAIQATESSLQEIKEEADPESMIPKTSVPNYQTSVVKHTAKATEPKKTYRSREQLVNQADWEEKRSREEKLVADIIDRVRRECEAHPTPQASTRRPYARRTTPVIHTLRQTNALT